MPALLVGGNHHGGRAANAITINRVQVRNEQAKQALVAAHPTLHEAIVQLEDHELLRGGLTVFDPEPRPGPARNLPARARQFPFCLTLPRSAPPFVKGPCRRQPPAQFGPSPGVSGRQAAANRAVESHWRIRYNGHPLAPPPAGLLVLTCRGPTLQPSSMRSCKPLVHPRTGATTSPNTGPCAVCS